jgi:hypothetical protein
MALELPPSNVSTLGGPPEMAPESNQELKKLVEHLLYSEPAFEYGLGGAEFELIDGLLEQNLGGKEPPRQRGRGPRKLPHRAAAKPSQEGTIARTNKPTSCKKKLNDKKSLSEPAVPRSKGIAKSIAPVRFANRNGKRVMIRQSACDFHRRQKLR